jgi:threonine 3-dehydrogenase
VVLPESNVWVHHQHVDPDLGAIFDPLGNATHTALSFPLVGEDVLITGAGPIGIMAAAVARRAGARSVVITDYNDFRLGLAAKFADVRPVQLAREDLRDVMAEEGVADGFGVALEMSGAPQALETCVDALAMGGKLALLGLPAKSIDTNWGKIILKALTVKGVYGREMFETWRKMLGLVHAGFDLEALITHRVPANDFEDGFSAALSGQSGKVVMRW